jgi:hypothetical protein
MKTFKDVAGLFKTLAQTYMVSGPWRPAYKTGNLYKRVGDFNTANQMLREEEGKYTLVLNYAPPGAEYGKFVHDGHRTRSGGFVEARPFAQFASQDATLKSLIEEVIINNLKKEADKVGAQLDIKFGAFTKK